jgi:enoyl-CoA hydratase
VSLADYEFLTFSRPELGVLLITIDRPEQFNAANERLHQELGRVWRDVAADAETRVAVITGAGRAFAAGGDIELLRAQINDYNAIVKLSQEVLDIVYGMIDCDKPIISAINGMAVGPGMAVALLADISIIAENARLTDGHAKLGVAAGDHAAIIWPLLCGMAKAKYYLLTSDFIGGAEAERIGLVSRCVPDAEVVPSALEIATRLAAGPQHALRWTKRSLNHWLRTAAPSFEASMAYEMLGFFGPDVVEGERAISAKDAARFPTAQSQDPPT